MWKSLERLHCWREPQGGAQSKSPAGFWRSCFGVPRVAPVSRWRQDRWHLQLVHTNSDRHTTIPMHKGDLKIGTPEDDALIVEFPGLEGARTEVRSDENLVVRVPTVLSARIQIRQARAVAGLSQSELARRIGVTQQQVANIESPDGDIRLGTLERAADALELTIDLRLRPKTA